MRAAILAAAALAFMSASGAASAREVPAGGFTIDDIRAWLKSDGFDSTVINDTDGKQHVRAMVDGVKLGVYPFDCKNGRCGSIQFSVGFDTHGKFDVSDMNRWNRDRRWCRGYFDKSNDPWIEMDVDLSPGGTYELLEDEFVTYRSAVTTFKQWYHL
jgi:hypothetical protein